MDGGKPALVHIMCATLISEAMNISKWRLLSVVSVRDVFGGTCGIFLGNGRDGGHPHRLDDACKTCHRGERHLDAIRFQHPVFAEPLS